MSTAVTVSVWRWSSTIFVIAGLFSAAGASCVGRCGLNFDSSELCQCNDDCLRFGDCCSDYVPVCEDVGPEEVNSCRGRCGDNLDKTVPCQCNDECVRFGDCCADYQTICLAGSGSTPAPSTPITNSELSALGDILWAADVNKFQDSEVQVNLRETSTRASEPFFDFVDESRFTEPSYRLFINLLDNYNHRTGIPEPALTETETAEVEEYLDFLLSTPVIQQVENFLTTKGRVSDTEEFRRILHDIWFKFYSRSSSTNIVDSSGFEHVFVGEHKSSSVTGFHSWVQMYLLERSGDLIYLGYNHIAEPSLFDNKFTWDDLTKSRASMFVGTSPEFDVALYSLCFLARPGSVCETSISGNPVFIQTFDVGHVTGLQVASAFPMVNGP